MTQVWINGEPFEGHAELSITNDVDLLYDGDAIFPTEVTLPSVTRTLTFSDPAIYEQMVAACTRPIADVTVAFTTLRMRRRLARLGRLGWLVRRPRGRRLLRVTRTDATITIHNVEFAAP